MNRIMEDNVPLSYLYSPNIQGLLWDPSSLPHAVVPPLSSGDRRNEKREAPSYLPLVSNKRSYVPDNIYEALQQTTIPSVPQEDLAADADDEATACPIVPVIDFFSNGVFFYDSGNAPVQEEAPYPSAPLLYDFGISVVPRDVEDDSSDEEVVYSDEGDLQPTERGNVKCRTLWALIMFLMCREGYACPICYESPVSPVSTICGHVFCEKCIKRLFRVGAWGSV